jgi:hypothetical protein
VRPVYKIGHRHRCCVPWVLRQGVPGTPRRGRKPEKVIGATGGAVYWWNMSRRCSWAEVIWEISEYSIRGGKTGMTGVSPCGRLYRIVEYPTFPTYLLTQLRLDTLHR